MSLEKKFVKRNVLYQQIQVKNDVALYSLSYPHETRIIGFDVFRLSKVGERVFDGKTVVCGGGIPGSEAYGTSAWSYTTQKAAETKFNELGKSDTCGLKPIGL